MRIKSKNGSISVNAVAGSYVVLLGMDMDAGSVAGLLGFAIERTDHTENERYWLKGFKTFATGESSVNPGVLVSSAEAPFQTFLWGDYTAKADHDYTYRVVAVRGKPKNLVLAEEVSVRVQTESSDSGTHSVWFNRGVAGSQAYVRRFGDKHPSKVPGGEAWKWLSRGLEEALLAFIGQARSDRYALRAALYEFHHEPVLEAFKTAAGKGADVSIVVDQKPNSKDYPRKSNRKAISKAGIDSLVIPRAANPSYISHNKFIVLLKDGKPEAVWTGSTNISQGGIFGHSNVGHVVRDPAVAGAFLDYWTELSGDPGAKDLRPWTDANTPTPAANAPGGTTCIFSPRPDLIALEWYAAQIPAWKKPTFLTLAFGVNPKLKEVLDDDHDFLRYILLEKGEKDSSFYSADMDNRIAVGNVLEEGAFKKWMDEQTVPGLNGHVHFVHTKYMLIDPLGPDPLTITGSANFSDASTKNNDENMLIIRGDTRVADIYVGEFMRLFNHHYFRFHVNRMSDQKRKDYSNGFLKPDDSWTKLYYKDGEPRTKERLYFAG